MWVTANFRVQWPEWAHLFMTTISINLYQRAKNQSFSSFCSTDIVDLKILQSDWRQAFLFISREPEFFQIWDLPKHTATDISFHYRINLKKLTKLSYTFKKPWAWLIFPHFGGKNFIFKKSGSTWAPNTMLSSRKN